MRPTLAVGLVTQLPFWLQLQYAGIQEARRTTAPMATHIHRRCMLGVALGVTEIALLVSSLWQRWTWSTPGFAVCAIVFAIGYAREAYRVVACECPP
jgi:hypothetical protein